MKTTNTLRLVTLSSWRNEQATDRPKPISINPAEVSDVEDYCGNIKPGSVITLKNKKTYLVAGKHEDIVALLTAKGTA